MTTLEGTGGSVVFTGRGGRTIGLEVLSWEIDGDGAVNLHHHHLPAPPPMTSAEPKARTAAAIFRAMSALLRSIPAVFRMPAAGPEMRRGRRRHGRILRANPTIYVTRPAWHVPHPDRALRCVAD